VPEEEEQQEGTVEPPVSGQYVYTQTDSHPAPEKRPGWFATHWYWLGLIPAVWGAWNLLKILFVIILALINFAGYNSITEIGLSEVIASAGAIPMD